MRRRPSGSADQSYFLSLIFSAPYKDFSDREIDTIEIMLQKLYAKFVRPAMGLILTG